MPNKNCIDCGASVEDRAGRLNLYCLPCWHRRDAIGQSAGRIARKAIKKGLLVRQPCEICGALRVDAHHEDYSKPLQVRWLCRKHHRQRHHESYLFAREALGRAT